MADVNSIFSSLASGVGSTVQVVIWVLVIGLIVITIVGLIGWKLWSNKRYNLKIEIKKIRSDGKFVSGEWGKGLYSVKRGALFIKRKGIRGTTSVKLLDIRKYLQGEDLLTVIQVSTDDMRPVLPESWTSYIEEYEDEKTGKRIQIKEAVLNIKVDSGLNKPWKTAFENASKRAYSLVNILQQFQTPIAIGIVIICCFVGFAILYSKISSK